MVTFVYPHVKVYSLKIERKEFHHGQGIETGPLVLRASALSTELSRTSTDP